MTIKAVIFDIGNVLVQWQPEAFFHRTVGPDRAAEFLAAVPIYEMNERVDAGTPLDEAVAEMARQHPEFTTELEMWRTRYIETIGPVIDHSVRLLRALRRADVPVYALSNFGAESFAEAEREYPFLEEFDERFVSAHMKLTKPDPAIYQHVEDRLPYSASALLFTDDRADNIEAARERGWKVHLFEGPEGLAARLVAEGLLTPEAAA